MDDKIPQLIEDLKNIERRRSLTDEEYEQIRQIQDQIMAQDPRPNIIRGTVIPLGPGAALEQTVLWFAYYAGGMHDFVISHPAKGVFSGYFSGNRTALATRIGDQDIEQVTLNSRRMGDIMVRLIDGEKVEVFFGEVDVVRPYRGEHNCQTSPSCGKATWVVLSEGGIPSECGYYYCTEHLVSAGFGGKIGMPNSDK